MVLLLVAVAYAPAASAAGPGGYPAVNIELLPDSSAEVLTAQGVFQATENARALTRRGAIMNRFPKNPSRPWHWYRAGTHPLLASVLPGTSFYLAEHERHYARESWDEDDWAYVVAVRGAKSYLLPDDLGQLLLDAGMEFENSDVPVWMDVGTLVWACAERHYLLGVWQDDIPPSRRGDVPFLPALTLDSIHIDTLGRDVWADHEIFMHVGDRAMALRVLSQALPPTDGGVTRTRNRLSPIMFVAPDDCGGRGIDINPVQTGLKDDPDLGKPESGGNGGIR